MGVDQLKLLAARHHYTTKCCSLRKTTNNHQKIGNQQQPSTPRKPRRSLSTEAAVFDRGSRQPADTSPSPIKSQKKHRRARVREAAALALERLRGARAAALRNKTRVTEIGGELYILPRQPRGRRGGRRGVGSQLPRQRCAFLLRAASPHCLCAVAAPGGVQGRCAENLRALREGTRR